MKLLRFAVRGGYRGILGKGLQRRRGYRGKVYLDRGYQEKSTVTGATGKNLPGKVRPVKIYRERCNRAKSTGDGGKSTEKKSTRTQKVTRKRLLMGGGVTGMPDVTGKGINMSGDTRRKRFRGKGSNTGKETFLVPPFEGHCNACRVPASLY
jgi:hypothetical protein